MGQYCSSSRQVAGHGAAVAGDDGFKSCRQKQQQQQQPPETGKRAAPPRRKAMKHAYDASGQQDLVLVVSLDSITKIG
uniref:Uncharacterized protein n=1 Tax=Oryza brachyantha TaxID=4533 RepID=J3NDP6_ORYBR